jgi:hypothetical protein
MSFGVLGGWRYGWIWDWVYLSLFGLTCPGDGKCEVLYVKIVTVA